MPMSVIFLIHSPTLLHQECINLSISFKRANSYYAMNSALYIILSVLPIHELYSFDLHHITPQHQQQHQSYTDGEVLSSSGANPVFTLTGFARLHTGADIGKIADDTEKQLNSSRQIDMRIEQLSQLSARDIPRAERLAQLKAMLARYVMMCDIMS
jgi:hypothetical protein